MLTLRSIRRLGTPFCLVAFAACRTADSIAPPPATIYLVTTSESIVPVGSAVIVTAQLADANNHPISGPPRLVAWGNLSTGPAGRFYPSVSVTDSSGMARVSYTAPLVAGATFRIRASSSDGTVGTSPVVTTSAGPPARYMVTPSARYTPPASPVTINAQLLDAYGNVVSLAGRVATWSSTGPGGSFSSSTSATNASGIATITFTTSTLPSIAHTVTAKDSGGVTGSSLRIATTLSIPALRSVATGAMHSCALTQAGRAFCWGRNSEGQLGDGTTLLSDMPLGVSTTASFVALAAAGNRTCGLTGGGEVYCWGLDTVPQASPVQVSGGLAFLALSAGETHTCGLVAGGAAYCWGRNGGGQLGNGSGISSSTPVAVSGGLRFSELSAGPDYTCGVTTGGAAYCWGANRDGNLGDSTLANRMTPVAVSGGLRFARVSAGIAHTCGVTTANQAYCWGANGEGQLGNGSTRMSSTPVPVQGNLAFATLSAGIEHTCGVTITKLAYCWGANGFGELGGGRASPSAATTPQLVAGELTFLSVSASGGVVARPDYYYGGFYADATVGHTCGITTTFVAYCWGSNLYRELGTSTAESFSAVPLKVMGQQ